ncbi:MAG TPA: GDP-mannose 4,6-dehydratase [Solirubrobacterales bacterium]|nr:GDP-mannose 4,6-dehydratase [Solirubrobacterales bacterium]
MKLLITGGAGFVGGHLSERLLKAGHSVHVIDDLSTGSINNISHLKDSPDFSYTIESVDNVQLMAELVDEADMIYHLAAAVGVQLIVDSPIRALETNIRLTEIVLNLASKKGKPVLFTSTSEVYGKSRALPFAEDGDLTFGATDKGRWAYACSKAIDEFLALAYYRERGLPTVTFRLFNTVGPRQTGRYGMVIPRLVSQALSGRPLTVYGDGEQRRCFCHVSDTVEALVGMLEVETAYGRVFNVGSQEETSIVDLARRIIDRTNSESEIVFVPYEEAYERGFEDMERRIPDLTRVGEEIGWQTSRDLNEIIDDVVAYTQFSSGTATAV